MKARGISAGILLCLLLQGSESIAASQSDTSGAALSVPDSVFNISDSLKLLYSKPESWAFITNCPRDYRDYAKVIWRKESIVPAMAIVASTAILMVLDQHIVDNVQHVGREIGVEGTTQTSKVVNWSIKTGNTSVALPLLFPQDINSSLYFLGDGFVHVGLVFGFWGYGLAANNYRARSTASQLTEAMLTVGLTIQVLKHISGRETPGTSTQTGGKWQFFPNQAEYAKHVPHYDAFPTGHLATAMATVTVIADNYPEKRLIRPIGYSLIALCGLSMINNGVHWMSDYPLGIAIGYGFAKVITNRSHRETARSPGHTGQMSMLKKLHPLLIPDFQSGFSGASLLCTF